MREQNPDRRKFLKLGLAGTLAVKTLLFPNSELKAKTGKAGISSSQTGADIKLAMGHLRPYMMTDEVFNFIKQLGVEYVEVLFPPGEDSYEDIVRIKRKIEKAGLKICSTLSIDGALGEEVVLGLPGRDEKITKYQNFIRNISKAGIHTTNYGFSAFRGISDDDLISETYTRGCKTQLFDMRTVQKKAPKYERKYTSDELWDNYIYFIKRILPVAEEAKIRLALHPPDPPIEIGGVENIFINKKDFEKAMEISGHSPYSGLLFCVGTWAEMRGPDGKGEDIIGAIHHFGRTGNIFHVHFRNVSSPIPRYSETFIDNGYLDMHAVMKAFKESGYTGAMEPDHVPEFRDEKRVGYYGVSGYAYSIGYMRGLLDSVMRE